MAVGLAGLMLALLLLPAGCAQTLRGSAPPPSQHILTLPAEPTPRVDSAGLTHIMQGLYFLHLGKIDAAIPHLRLALLYAPRSAFVYERLSRAWASADEPERARRAMVAGLNKVPNDPWLNRLAGDFAFLEGRYPDAVAHLRKALETEATVSRAAPVLVEALLWMGDSGEAIREARRWMVDRPGDFAVALELAMRLEDHGELKVALEAYRQARMQRPADQAAAYGEMRVLVLLERYAEAAESLIPLFAFYPDAPDLYVQIARLLFRAKRGDAEAYRAEALRQTEGEARAWSVVAAGDLLEGRFVPGVTLLREIVQSNPEDLDARIFLAESLLRHGDARGCLTQLSAPRSQARYFHRLRAACAAASGSVASALEALRAAIEEGPNPRDALNDGARILGSALEPDEAREQLEQLLATAKGRVDEDDALIARALLADLLGAGKEALEVLEGVSEPRADDPDYRFRRADLEARHGSFEVATELLEQLRREAPNDPSRLNALGYTLADAGVRLQEASVWLRRAYRFSSDNGYVLDSLGWLLYKQGRLHEAMPLLKRAALASPGDPEILGHLGDLYRDSGVRNSAQAAYRAALEAGPTPALRKSLQQRLLEMGSS